MKKLHLKYALLIALQLMTFTANIQLTAQSVCSSILCSETKTEEKSQNETNKDDKDKIDFTIYGEGGLKNNLLNKADNNKVANGSIAIAFIKDKSDLNIAFSLADITSKEVTDKKFLGGALLAPTLEKNSFSMRYNRYFNKAMKEKRFSINSYILATADKWSIDSTNYGANIFAANISVSYYPYEFEIDDKGNKVKLWFDLGFNYRRLFGEIIELENTKIREETFGTKHTRYYGIEPAANLLIGKTVLFARAPFYFRRTNDEGFSETIKGLSNFQLQIGANVFASVLSFKKKDSRDKPTKPKKDKVKS